MRDQCVGRPARDGTSDRSHRRRTDRRDHAAASRRSRCATTAEREIGPRAYGRNRRGVRGAHSAKGRVGMNHRLPEKIARRLRLPLIAAPMLAVSGPELGIAACKAGVIGAFPVANARTIDTLESWLTKITGDLEHAANENP